MSTNCFYNRMTITPENGYLKEYAFLYSYMHNLRNDPNNLRYDTYYKKINISDNSYIEMEYNSLKNYDFFTYHKNNVIVEFRNFDSDSVMIEVRETLDDGKNDVHIFPCNEFFIQNMFYKIMEKVSEIFESEIEDYEEKEDGARLRIMKVLKRL